jgi:hypothetical protein
MFGIHACELVVFDRLLALAHRLLSLPAWRRRLPFEAAPRIIGVALAGRAAALVWRSADARDIAAAATMFAIAGFVLGLTFTVRGGHAVDVA